MLCGVILLAGCSSSDTIDQSISLKTNNFYPISYALLPGWNKDQQDQALPALLASCQAYEKNNFNQKNRIEHIEFSYNWFDLCDNAKNLKISDQNDARKFFEKWFIPYVFKSEPEGLFTGYYEPLLQGSRVKTSLYQVPLYRRPPDLIEVNLAKFIQEEKRTIWGRNVKGKLLPYFKYEEIDQGALSAKNLELIWLKDRVDAFFLSIQGSGLISLGQGEKIRIGYDGKNGHPYFPIGKKLIDDGFFTKDTVSMLGIVDWLRAHPNQAQQTMYLNPSYIFFREINGSKNGPIGALGVELTPERSIAVDPSYIPLGIPLWVDLKEGQSSWQKLVLAQDTGGAIKGKIRGDIFFGTADQAMVKASSFKNYGTYYILLPQGIKTNRL
ncbi:MAG: MltA domain-containing protein [Alphaproteobacteria bacterium]|nr:MltA domain-containing protein [Alphaproteobacteria bacterium]